MSIQKQTLEQFNDQHVKPINELYPRFKEEIEPILGDIFIAEESAEKLNHNSVLWSIRIWQVEIQTHTDDWESDNNITNDEIIGYFDRVIQSSCDDELKSFYKIKRDFSSFPKVTSTLALIYDDLKGKIDAYLKTNENISIMLLEVVVNEDLKYFDRYSVKEWNPSWYGFDNAWKIERLIAQKYDSEIAVVFCHGDAPDFVGTTNSKRVVNLAFKSGNIPLDIQFKIVGKDKEWKIIKTTFNYKWIDEQVVEIVEQ